MMDLLDLKIFKQLYIQRNISAVSRFLYLSQPTISYRLNKLQQELNITLYAYDGEYHFTPQGKVFYEYCERILRDHDELVTRLESMNDFTVNLSTVATYLYLEPIYKLLHEKGFFPRIYTCRSDEAIRNIIDHQADVAIVGGVNMELPRHIDVIPLKDERIVLVYHQSLSHDIRKIPLVIDQKDSGIHAVVLNYLEQFDQVNIVAEMGTTADRLALINHEPLGLFINETYLKEIQDRYPHIVISDTYQIHRNILLLAGKSSRYGDIIHTLIEKLNNLSPAH
jgi:DNA-binding transcriptional LysR family regulator